MAPFNVAITLPLILLLPSLILAQSSAGPCVGKCGPIASFCDGDETGPALDDCSCATFLSSAPFISCIKACPETEVAKYAGLVPEKCRGQLFPGVAAVERTTSSAGGSPTATTTGSVTEETEGSSTTVESAAASATTGGGSDGAGVRNALAWPAAAAAVGGVLAAFAL